MSTRREFVSAMGAGAMATRWPRLVPQGPGLTVWFHGVILVTAGAGDYTELLFPLAEGDDRKREHDDGQHAMRHYAYMVDYPVPKKPADRKLYEHLLGRDLTLSSTAATQKRKVGEVFALEKIAEETQLRSRAPADFNKYYAARITLKGGKFTALDNRVIGKWGTPPTLRYNTVSPEFPSTLWKWEAYADEAVLADSTKSLTLKASEHPCIHVGHQKDEPTKWKLKTELDQIHVDKKDDDFKWHFAIVVPTTITNEQKPWAAILDGRDLPTPIVSKPPTRSQIAAWRNRPPLGPSICIDSSGPGTPTCFGGCWGCE